jgi:hypothetical protein
MHPAIRWHDGVFQSIVTSGCQRSRVGTRTRLRNFLPMLKNQCGNFTSFFFLGLISSPMAPPGSPNPIATTPKSTGRTPTPFLHTATPLEFSDLDDNELFVLLSLAKCTLAVRGHLPNSPVPPPKPYDIFDNAKYEQIACLGLKPRYNGTPNDLIPTLNAIHIRRQNEAWYFATFLPQGSTVVDLVKKICR